MEMLKASRDTAKSEHHVSGVATNAKAALSRKPKLSTCSKLGVHQQATTFEQYQSVGCQPVSTRGIDITKRREGCGERVKENESERRALLSWLSWPVSFESFDVRHARVFLPFFVPPCGVHSSDRIFNALI